MRRLFVALLALAFATSAFPAAGADEVNVLDNPSLLEAVETKYGEEPEAWTRRGQLQFSDAKIKSKDSAFQVSMTAPSDADFPEDCSVGGKLHYDGAEAGYFQVYPGIAAGQTWQLGVGTKLKTGGRARIFLYAKDDKGGNLAWVDALSENEKDVWRRLRVTITLPEGTVSVWAVFRGRMCSAGTEKFRFRRANMHLISE